MKQLLSVLEARFKKNMNRHKGLAWPDVQARLEAGGAKTLRTLGEMESTGGEPDVVGQDKKTGAYIFCDFQRRVPRAAAVCVTTVQRSRRGKSINRKTMRWT